MPNTSHQRGLTLGDLVAAAFDCAMTVTSDERQAAELAASILARRFARADRPDLALHLRGLVAAKGGAAVERAAYARAA